MSSESIDWTALDDDAFVSRAELQIWMSAFAANNPRAPAHKEAHRAWEDAARRGKPWLYCRAYNAAYRSCGYEPSQEDIDAAKEPEGRC